MDAEDVSLINLRAQCLVKLNRQEEAAQTLEGLKVDGLKAKEAYEVSEKQVENLQTELESAKREDEAALLREHLHEGEACPVCLQLVESYDLI